MEIRKQDALEYHRRDRKGKIEITPTKPCRTQWDLSLAYTPGVAEPCLEIRRGGYCLRGSLPTSRHEVRANHYVRRTWCHLRGSRRGNELLCCALRHARECAVTRRSTAGSRRFCRSFSRGSRNRRDAALHGGATHHFCDGEPHSGDQLSRSEVGAAGRHCGHGTIGFPQSG